MFDELFVVVVETLGEQAFILKELAVDAHVVEGQFVLSDHQERLQYVFFTV